MRMQRRGMALLGATAVASLWAFAVACSDTSPWPQTVLSGNAGGGVGGGSQGGSDASSGDDTGADDAGDASEGETGSGFVALFSCENFGSGTGYCTTYKQVQQAVATQLEGACSGSSLLLQNTVCPQGSSTATEGVTVGCCTSTSSGYTLEQCFYGSNTNNLTTMTGCSGTGGTLTSQPQ